MESWQRDHFNRNLSQLLKKTTCTDSLLDRLLSDDILADVDIEMITSTPERAERVQLLYAIVETRKNGFVAMAKTLAVDCQSDACRILTEGLAHHLTQAEIMIDFLKNVKPLSEYLDVDQLNETKQIFIEFCSNKEIIEVYESVQSNDGINKLVNQTIPLDLPLYMPRTLFKRLVVNKELFEEVCPDIFVFKDIGINKLMKFINYRNVAPSSSQLVQISSRFIQLDSEDDWNYIRDIAQVPVHLIKYEDHMNTFILEKTTGESRVLQEYVNMEHFDRTNKFSAFVGEDTLVENVVNNKCPRVCISDSPGTGKTMLLASLANKIAARCPNRLVAFIPLSKFIQHIKAVKNAPKVDAEFARTALLNFLCSSPLAAILVGKILTEQNISLELFLDGFDEVQHEHAEFTKMLLAEITFGLPSTRVYVTSRPHLRHQLEASFQSIAYHILPYTRKAQAEFLVQYWTSTSKKLSQKKLLEFADYLINKLINGITKEEMIISGIPLICRILAHVYSRNAQIYSKSTRTIPLESFCQLESSLPGLYKQYMEHAFSKLKNQSETLFLSVKEYHTWIAIRTIFPEIQNIFLDGFKLTISNAVAEQCASTGLLEDKRVDGVILHDFVHRTFAEYLVSEFVVNNLKNVPITQKDLTNVLFERFLRTEQLDESMAEYTDFQFSYPTIIFFVNNFAKEVSIPWTDHFTSKSFMATVPPKRLYTLLVGCLRECYGNIFNMIQNILLILDVNVRELYKVELVPTTVYNNPTKLRNLIEVTSEYSNISLAKQLFHFFLECFDCDLNVVCKDMLDEFETPLHRAVYREDLELVQFFARSISLVTRDIMNICRIYSNEDSLKVKNTIQICELLLAGNENVKEMECPDYCVHVEMLKLLFRMGVNLRVIKKRETVVHRAAKYMRASNFHELTRFLIEECHSCDLFMRNELEWKCPLNFVLSKQENMEKRTLEMILDVPGVNAYEVDDSENTIFLSALKGKQKAEILEAIIKLGVGPTGINRYGQGAVHLAAENGDLKMLQFLLEQGLDSCQVDMAGNSFLHYFAWNPITPEQYKQIICMLVRLGHDAVFHIRNIDEQLPIHVAIRDVDVDEVTLKLLREKGVDFNSTDKHNWSLLMYAALGKRSANLLQTLIKMGVDINIKDRDGNTFAHCIFKHNIMEYCDGIYTFLVESRGLLQVHVEGHDSRYFVANKFAVQRSFESVTDLRQSYGNVVEITSVSNKNNVRSGSENPAERKCSRQFWKILGEMGVEMAEKDEPESTDQIIEYYSSKDYRTILEMLNEIDRDAKILGTVNDFGQSPLHLAVLDSGLDVQLLNLIIGKLAVANVFKSSSAWGNQMGPMLINAAKGDKRISFLKKLTQLQTNVMSQDEDGNTFAHHCAKYCTAGEYHDIMQFVLEIGHGKIFQMVNKDGASPIHWAVRYLELLECTLNIIKCQLVETRFVDINATDNDGFSTLMHAVIGKRSVALLGALIEMGADAMIEDDEGNTIAHWMPNYYTAEEYHDLVQLLIDKGNQKVFQKVDRNGESPLHRAFHDLELSESTLYLINCQLVEPNFVDIDSIDSDGNSLVMHAVKGNRSVAFLSTLIEIGANAMVEDNEGNTIAHWISQYYTAESYHDAVQLLIDKGYQNIFQKVNQDGVSPLHWAVRDLELSEPTLNLIQYQLVGNSLFDINSVDNDGVSLLMYAVIGKRSVALLGSLIEMGANVMTQDSNGNTIAHWMSRYLWRGTYQIVMQFLFDSGHHKVFLKVNKKGASPIDWAVRDQELSESTLNLIKCQLVESGLFDIGQVDNDGDSLLMYAVRGKRSARFLIALLKMGANVMTQNNEGNTIAHLMSKYYSAESYGDLMQLLIDNGHQKIFLKVNNKGVSPLHQAVRDMELSETTLNLIKCQLVESSLFNINSADNDGITFLMYAIDGKRSVVFLRTLIEMGADVMAQDEKGNTIAHWMPKYYTAKEYHKIIELLFEKGQESVFQMPNKVGATGFHSAVLFLELLPESLDYLFASNTSMYRGRPNLDIVSTYGDSVLHLAVAGGRSLQFVQHLVNLGADWSVTNNHKTSLAHRSASLGLIDHLKYFVELGCNINDVDSDGDNVLQCAIHDAHESEHFAEMVEFLLEKSGKI